MHQKLVPDPFLILLNNQKKPLHASNSFKNKVFWKRIIKKPLKSQVYFFIRPQSLLMDKVIKNKTDLELITSQSSGNEKSSKKFLYSYILSDQVWWQNVKQVLSYSINYIFKFMQVNSWYNTFFHFHFSFWIWKVWKGREKITKTWISRERKELFRWNKKYFS